MISDADVVNKYKEIKNIKSVSKCLGISRNIVRKILICNNINIKRNIRQLDHNSFKDINNESCYWAGFLAADGNVSKDTFYVSLGLWETDIEHIKKFLNFVKSDRHIFIQKRKQKSGLITTNCSVRIYSQQIKKDLCKNFNVVPQKTKILDPPNINNIENIKNFIRGYFDGDGSISWNKTNNKPRFEIASSSHVFINWIKNIFSKHIASLGNPKILQCKRFGTYKLDYSGFQSLRILSWLYENTTQEVRLERKYNKFLKYMDVEKTFIENREIKKENIVNRNKKIIKLRNDGLSYPKIAKQVGVCPATCFKVINDIS